MKRFYFSTPTYERLPAFWLALAGFSAFIGAVTFNPWALVPISLSVWRFWSISWQRFERTMYMNKQGERK